MLGFVSGIPTVFRWFIFMPIPLCFDYCNLVVNFQVKSRFLSLFFFKIVIWVYLTFYMNEVTINVCVCGYMCVCMENEYYEKTIHGFQKLFTRYLYLSIPFSISVLDCLTLAPNLLVLKIESRKASLSSKRVHSYKR